MAEEAHRAVGLGHRIKCLPGQLSETRRRRISIARVLVNNPAVIIAEEPTKSEYVFWYVHLSESKQQPPDVPHQPSAAAGGGRRNMSQLSGTDKDGG